MKQSILHKMSSDDFDRRELDTKNHGIVPNWWKGVTTLALTAVERFEKQYLSLQKGWYITCNPEELLEKFNASQSDAHSLECGDFERLNEDWKKFCRNENYYNSPFINLPPSEEKKEEVAVWNNGLKKEDGTLIKTRLEKEIEDNSIKTYTSSLDGSTSYTGNI